MTKKVLLTGAAGFIGRHAIPLMAEKGYEVHAVDSIAQPPFKQKLNIFWHQCDLLNAVQQKHLIAEIKPTHLLHFAWHTTPGKYWTSLENFRWVQSSLSLLQEFHSHGGSRIVMAGTCAEYDWKHEHYSEQTTPLAPATLYGTCKHSLQSMLNSFCKETGLSSAWGRIFFLYGPHEHPARLVPSVIRSLLRGETARCSHGKQIRDFLHVEDVADAFVTLLESEVTGPVNIASGQPVALKDVICKIADKMNRRDLVQLGAIPAPADEPALLVADVSRLMSEVGWKSKYTLEDGLSATIDWWHKHLKI